MIFIKIAIMLIGSGLFFWGGFSFKPARRFILPTLLSISCLILTHSWWCLTMLSCMAAFSLGYGESAPLRKVFGDGWGRSVWGLIAAICLCGALVLIGHVLWYLALPYLALNFILENALKNIEQRIGDPIIGLGFSSIVLLIK